MSQRAAFLETSESSACWPRRSDTIAIVPEPIPAVGKTLSKVQIFSGLSEGELSFLAQRAVPRRYSVGQSVFGEGEPCSGLYVVESGHVRIFKSSANGREQVLSIDGPGSSIAELPVFDGGTIRHRQPRSTTPPCFLSANRIFRHCVSPIPKLH